MYRGRQPAVVKPISSARRKGTVGKVLSDRGHTVLARMEAEAEKSKRHGFAGRDLQSHVWQQRGKPLETAQRIDMQDSAWS